MVSNTLTVSDPTDWLLREFDSMSEAEALRVASDELFQFLWASLDGADEANTMLSKNSGTLSEDVAGITNDLQEAVKTRVRQVRD